MAHLVLGRAGARLLEGRGRNNVEGGALRGKAGRFWAEGVGEQGDTREGRASPVSSFSSSRAGPAAREMAPWKLRRGKQSLPERPGFLARGPGKSNVTSDALPVPAAYAIHGEDRDTLALAAVAEDPPTTAAGELET